MRLRLKARTGLGETRLCRRRSATHLALDMTELLRRRCLSCSCAVSSAARVLSTSSEPGVLAVSCVACLTCGTQGDKASTDMSSVCKAPLAERERGKRPIIDTNRRRADARPAALEQPPFEPAQRPSRHAP